MEITSLVMVIYVKTVGCATSTFMYFTVAYVDIDECNLNLSMCQPDSYCNNTIGSYLCICNVGYSGDGFINCTSKSTELSIFHCFYFELFTSDINECKLDTDDCDENAECTDTIGSFSCDCNFGYTGSGRECCE